MRNLLPFSICTEASYIELWVHYPISKNSIRLYYMNIINICHVSLLLRDYKLETSCDGGQCDELGQVLIFVNHIANKSNRIFGIWRKLNISIIC